MNGSGLYDGSYYDFGTLLIKEMAEDIDDQPISEIDIDDDALLDHPDYILRTISSDNLVSAD